MMNYKIIFEDKDIIVCQKTAGIPVQTGKIGAIDLVSELKNYIMKSAKTKPAKEPYLGVVHRLDQPVEGVLVFAKTKDAARKLNQQMTAGKMDKRYLAVIEGICRAQEEELRDILPTAKLRRREYHRYARYFCPLKSLLDEGFANIIAVMGDTLNNMGVPSDEGCR